MEKVFSQDAGYAYVIRLPNAPWTTQIASAANTAQKREKNKRRGR